MCFLLKDTLVPRAWAAPQMEQVDEFREDGNASLPQKSSFDFQLKHDTNVRNDLPLKIPLSLSCFLASLICNIVF
jgi:hypothetical protein